MQIKTYESYDHLSNEAARMAADLVLQRPDAVLCLASGHTPLGVFRHFVRIALETGLDCSRCRFVGLDEWVGFSPEQEGGCLKILTEYLFNPLKINQHQIYFFQGQAADPQAECRRVNENVAGLGGIDFMLVGVGMNGHIGFNEPGTPWNLHAHVAELDETTRSVGQKYFSQETVISQGYTLGMEHLKAAGQAVLMASGSGKAPVIRQALEGDVTAAFPASIFQTLSNGVVMLDVDAASGLTKTT